MVFTFQPFMVNSFFPDLGKEELGGKGGQYVICIR